MKRISATEAKREFGEVLLKVQHAPIGIDKNGKPIAVVLSADAYAEITALNGQYLEQAIAEGMDDLRAGRVSSESDALERLRRLVAHAES